MNHCVLSIANWLCAGCLSGTCDLPARQESVTRPPPGQSAYTITLSLDKPATIAAEALTVELASVKDNRCAVEVKCVWAGDAEVELRVVRSGGTAATLRVGTAPPVEQSAAASTHGGYQFHLVALEPPNSMSKPVPQALYRVSINVSIPRVVRQ